ncbi:MAG: cache domain-containing protein [Halioglobus sp.]
MLLVVAAVGWGLSQWNLSNYKATVADRLQLLNELRRGALEQYFATAEAELTFWGTSNDIVAAQMRLNDVWAQGAPTVVSSGVRTDYVTNNPNPEGKYRELMQAGESDYDLIHAKLHPIAAKFVTQRGYYDFFLISPDGVITYSVEKERDYATSLIDGPYRDSGLAQSFRQALVTPDQPALSDMESYAPSQGAPAIFLARALRDDTGEVIGVIAFQLPTTKILQIMNYDSGMGETGETYLVGSDSIMRSDSRFSSESTVLTQVVDTDTVRLALKGEEGVEFTNDYRGVEVLSSYSSMNLGGNVWAVMAEIDRDEIIQNAATERPALAGVLMFFYALSLWSLWYWQGRPEANPAADLSQIDIKGVDFSDDGGNMMG